MTQEERDRYIDLNYSFWSGPDDGVIELRKVSVVRVRQRHACGWWGPQIGAQHFIEVGSWAVRDAAKYDGEFGTCYTCLPCLDRWGKECRF